MYYCGLEKYQENIRDILKGLCELFDESCSHIFLYGSAASNNLSYKLVDGKIDFYSDIEFIVVPFEKDNENNKAFKKWLMEKAYEYVKLLPNVNTPPFVDVNSVSKEFFENSQFRISTYELKNNAKCLKGENYLDLLPMIDSTNYIPAIQNIEIVKGLKVLLLESNKYFLKKDSKSEEEGDYKYSLYSSYLNVLRTLLPLFDVFELSVEGRLRKLREFGNSEILTYYFSSDVLDGFERIYEEKKDCSFSMNVKELFRLTYSAYRSLLCFILKCPESELISSVSQKRDILFWGSDDKKNMLVKLACFFISSLDCLLEMVMYTKISNSSYRLCKKNYDELIQGQNSFGLMQVINNYEIMEKYRWKIIGSKD